MLLYRGGGNEWNGSQSARRIPNAALAVSFGSARNGNDVKLKEQGDVRLDVEVRSPKKTNRQWSSLSCFFLHDGSE
jgi:hypothetical protein